MIWRFGTVAPVFASSRSLVGILPGVRTWIRQSDAADELGETRLRSHPRKGWAQFRKFSEEARSFGDPDDKHRQGDERSERQVARVHSLVESR